MANVISLQFNEQVAVRTRRLKYTGSTGDNTDIEYFIGSTEYTAGYTNIYTSGELTVQSGFLTAATWDRNTASASGSWNADFQWRFENYQCMLETMVIRTRTLVATPTTWYIQAKNSVGAWIQIGSYANSDGNITTYTIDCSQDFWAREFRVVRASGTVDKEIYEVFSYGTVSNENNTELISPAEIPSDTWTLTDSRLDEDTTDGIIDYGNTIRTKDDVVWDTTRITLTGTSQMGSGFQSTILTYDPNGADRDLILPEDPLLDSYLRVINADGGNALNLKETSGGPTLVSLSNISGVLTVECQWDQVDSTWHLTF